MVTPRDLLRVAQDLLAGPSDEAHFRRAISTAYYALFRLCTEAAARQWSGSNRLHSRLEREFAHQRIKTVCLEFGRGSRPAWSDRAPTMGPELKNFAQKVGQLYIARSTADYDFTIAIKREDAIAHVQAAEAALALWPQIQTDPLFPDFLLALLIGMGNRGE